MGSQHAATLPVTRHPIPLFQDPQMMLGMTGNDPHKGPHGDRIVIGNSGKQKLDAC